MGGRREAQIADGVVGAETAIAGEQAVEGGPGREAAEVGIAEIDVTAERKVANDGRLVAEVLPHQREVARSVDEHVGRELVGDGAVRQDIGREIGRILVLGAATRKAADRGGWIVVDRHGACASGKIDLPVWEKHSTGPAPGIVSA